MTEGNGHVHNHTWRREGDADVNRCSCGDVQARLENAFDDDDDD
jgi:hypothetical protein